MKVKVLIETKICCSCKEERSLDFFNKNKSLNDGLDKTCKECKKIYYINNKYRIKEKSKKWRETNGHNKEYNSNYYINNREKLKIKSSENYYNNKPSRIKKQTVYRRKRLKEDINFKITSYLRTRLWFALKSNQKKGKTLDLIGCSINFLKEHLSKKFKAGMTFNNYGKWHIDHIIPCFKFDLTKEENQKICFHYTNLQPLWESENKRKSFL